MSARIGEVKAGSRVLGRVSASRGGVEVTIEGSLDPIEARNLAALIVRGSEETERMRRNDPEASRDERAGYAMAKRDAIAMAAFSLLSPEVERATAMAVAIREVEEAISGLDYERSSPLAPGDPR